MNINLKTTTFVKVFFEMNTSTSHKAGFVNIIGKPNVGKSTLMNQLMGDKLSIITYKAQTTRHRIMGIMSGDDFQIVYSDTPGIIEPKYGLHQSMMDYVHSALEDADILVFVTDIHEKHDETEVIKKLQRIDHIPLIVVINKIDLSNQEEVVEKINYWKELFPHAHSIIPMSALEGFNTNSMLETLVELLPNHPPFYDKEEFTTRTERFFASEIIREKIFLNYEKEVPYSCEVGILYFKDEPNILRISAEIYVERPTQKSIIIGKGGESIKRVGTQARIEMESFFGKKVFLETFVKVEPDWRNKKNKLDLFGYDR